MKRICPLLAAVALLGLSGTGIADTGGMVGFHAVGSATGTAVVEGTTEHITLAISLNMTHLGLSTGSATYDLDLTNLSFTGTFEATGRTGNSLSFSAVGQLTPVGECLFDFVQTFTITGGDGAFDSSTTGGGTSTGQFVACPLSSTVAVENAMFKGTVSRPNPPG